MSMTYLVLVAAVNLWAFRVVPWVELLAGIVNVVLFLVFLILVWVLAPQNSLDTFLTKSSVGGWGDFVSFNIDSLGTIYLFNGKARTYVKHPGGIGGEIMTSKI